MRIILVESKSSRRVEGFRTLTKACKALNLNYSTLTKVINSKCNYYENDSFKITRLPIQ